MIPLIYFRRPKLITDIESLLCDLAELNITRLVLAPEMGGLKLLNPQAIETLKALTKQYGVATPAIHGLFRHTNDLNSDRPEQMIFDHCRLLTHAAQLGVETYVMHPGLPLPDRTADQEWGAIYRALERILPMAETMGVVLAVENLPPEYLGNNPDDLRRVVEAFDSPNLRLCFDSGHAHMCGNAADFLKQIAPYVVTMHLHDNDGLTDRHLSPGDGTLNWDSLVPEIHKCPNVVHLEIETFNRDDRSHDEIWGLYSELLEQQA